MADLAARIGNRRPLYGNLTWTRPGLEEEQKARAHQAGHFGKSHRLSARHTSWDRTAMDCDSEASSSNEEDMQRQDEGSNVFSSPRTPSKPRIMRNRITSGKEHTSSGTLMERLGISPPPEDSLAVAVSAYKNPHLGSAASSSNGKSAVNKGSDELGMSDPIPHNGQTPAHGNRLHPPAVLKLSVDSQVDEGFGEYIPGLNMVQTRSDGDVTQSRVQPVGKLPCASASGTSPELIDSTRQLLVPLVVKKAEREAALSSTKATAHNLAQQAQAVITDDICEEFIRQAIASSSALKAILKKERPDQHSMHGFAMSTTTRQTTPTPPGLGLSAAVAETTPALPAANRAEGCASSGKTMLPSHPLPTGPRSMKDTESIPFNPHDDRGVGSSRSSFAYSTKAKERDAGANELQDRYGSRQSSRPRRSRSPRLDFGHRPPRSPNRSLSKAARRPSPGSYRHDTRRPHEAQGPRSPPGSHVDHRDTRHRSCSRPIERQSSARRRSPSLDYTERGPVRQRSPLYGQAERWPVRQYSPIHDERERQSARRESHSYDDRKRRLGRRPSPYHPRNTRASSPRHSISSSRAQGQAESPSRGRSPAPPPPQTPSDNMMKRKSYSPIRRGGPPRGWSREPPPQSTPAGPFPKKKKYDHDPVPARSTYERPAFSSDRPHRVSGSGGDSLAEGSPSKYRHICHRPPGFCQHASHDDDRSQSYDRLPHSVSASIHSRRERTPPVLKSESQPGQGYRRKPWPHEYLDTHGSTLPRSIPSTSSSFGDVVAAATPSKYHAPTPPLLTIRPDVHSGATLSSVSGVGMRTRVKMEQPEVHLDWGAGKSMNTGNMYQPATVGDHGGHSVEARIHEGIGAGDASRRLYYQHNAREDDPLSAVNGFEPPGLSAAPRIVDIASGSSSKWGSSSTVVQYMPTPPSQSSSTLLGQANDVEDRKPDIKGLEKLLATIQEQQRQHPLPLAPVLPLPSPTQPPSTEMVTLPSGPAHAVPALPTAMDTSTVIGSTPSMCHSTASSRAPTAPPVPSISSRPVRVKVEEDVDLEGLWPLHGAQQPQAPIVAPIPPALSLPPVTARVTMIKEKNRSQQRLASGNRHPGASHIPSASVSASSSRIATKKELPELSLRKPLASSEAGLQSGAPLTVPGVWLVQQGADSVKTVDRTFLIQDDLARKWDIPSQSEYDNDSSAEDEPWPAHKLGSTQPKVTLQLLCFSTDKFNSVDWRDDPEAVLALPQKWPMIQDLIIVSNHDTPGQRVWMSHDLPKLNGSGRPIRLERYIHAGPNTLRIIHLTNLSNFTFVLVAQPNLPRDEVPSRSVDSATADKYDDYFAKLRKDVVSMEHSQRGPRDSKPAVGSVTV